MNNTAKVVRALIDCCGDMTAKELSERTGIDLRAAQRAIKAIRDDTSVASNTSRCDTSVASPVSQTSNTSQPLARAQAIPKKDNNNNNTTEPRAQDVPQSVDVDDVKLRVKLIDAVKNQPMNQFAKAFENIQPIKDLIAEGYGLDSQIIPTIKKFRKTDSNPINGWGFWVTIVRSQHANPTTGKPKVVRYQQEVPDDFVTEYNGDESWVN